MIKNVAVGLFFGAMSLSATMAAAKTDGLRVVSLDMCADQYALALLPRERIAALSLRATHQDSFYRRRASGLAQRRVSVEGVLGLKPDVVLRTWGGDARLMARLKERGVKIIQINDVNNFYEAGHEVETVAVALGVPQAGQREAARMQHSLSRLPPVAVPRRVLYYTPSGYSAGPSTWVGELIGRTGHRLIASEDYFFYLSPEVFLKQTADVYALGFYEDAYAMRRAPGRHPLVRNRIKQSRHVVIPSPLLACNAWYGAFGLPALAEALS